MIAMNKKQSNKQNHLMGLIFDIKLFSFGS